MSGDDRYRQYAGTFSRVSQLPAPNPGLRCKWANVTALGAYVCDGEMWHHSSAIAVDALVDECPVDDISDDPSITWHELGVDPASSSQMPLYVALGIRNVRIGHHDDVADRVDVQQVDLPKPAARRLYELLGAWFKEEEQGL